MIELEKLYQQKQEALESGNLNLYLYLDGRFMERFAEKIISKNIKPEIGKVDLPEINGEEKQLPFSWKTEEPFPSVKSDDDLALSHKCYTVRKKRELTQKAFGALVGVSQSTISFIESGANVNFIRHRTVQRINDLYNETFHNN